MRVIDAKTPKLRTLVRGFRLSSVRTAMTLNRSQQLSRIRSKNTRPEIVLRRLLWSRGHRYRVHATTPVGRPDIVFKRQQVAVFVDGCFWHGCPDHYVRPRSSGEFWAAKLATNVRRDVEQTRTLECEGWRVCRIWEHQVFEEPSLVVSQIEAALSAGRWRPSKSWRVARVVEVDAELDRERRFMRELRTSTRRQVTQKRTTKKWNVAPEIQAFF